MKVWRWTLKASIHEPRSLFHAWWIFVVYFTTPALVGLAFGQGYKELEGLQDGGGQLSTVLFWAGIVGTTELARLGFLFFGAMEWTRTKTHTETILRANMLGAQLGNGADLAGKPVTSAGEAIPAFRDDTNDVALLADGLLDTVGAVCFALAAGAILGSRNVAAALVMVIPLAAVVLLVRSMDNKIKAYRMADRTASSKVSAMIGDLMSGATTVKVNGAIDPTMSELETLVRVRETTAVRDGVLDEGVYAASRGAANVALGLALLVATGAMADGSFGVGDIVLFVAYTRWMDFLPRMAGRMFARYKQTGVAFGRMGAIVADADPQHTVSKRCLPIDQRSGRGEDVPLLVTNRPHRCVLNRLEVCGLTARFPGGAGISDVSFSLEAGSFTVLTGQIGSGKSTLLRAMLGLCWQEDQTGEVKWNGSVLDDRGAFLIPPNASFLPQVPQLVSDSVADNVSLGDASPEAMDRAIALASIAKDLESLPDGLATMIGPRGLRLSGGQRQRLAAARALVHSPELVVLDDLSSALDVETEIELWSKLAKSGITVLAVSHRPVALSRADQVLRLENGRLV